MERQAWILRSFLAQLHSKEAEEDETDRGFAGEFMRLKRQSTKYRTDKTYPTKTAEKQENVKKNRYKDIVPFDHSRVKLSLPTSKNDSEYINASFIKGVNGSRAYIATQGPLPHTVLDFLRMVWEYNIEVIVMACREFEMGRKKCERYWPEKKEEAFVCDPFSVYCDKEDSKGDYLTRTLRLSYRSSTRTLHQLHYMNWPDHGVPDSIPPILEMLQDMRSLQAHDDVPICIHCSAGCGRTGALCVIDYTWNLVKTRRITEDFNIYDLVQDMRTQRPSVVQTKEQYELVYRTIRFLFERYLQSEEVPYLISTASESESSDLSEEFKSGPKTQDILLSQTLLSYPVEEEPWGMSNHVAALSLSMPEVCDAEAAGPSSSDVLSCLRVRDSQPQKQRPFSLQTIPTALATRREMEREESVMSQVLSQDPTFICLTVEDPYFGTESLPNSPVDPEASGGSVESLALLPQWQDNPCSTMPSLALNDQAMELPVLPASTRSDSPPPLPERTLESYLLAGDTESFEPSQRLEVIIPPNAAADALRELGVSPPSPVPPLPDRTPESFMLAIDATPGQVEQPDVSRSRLGTSSEWSGHTQDPVPQLENRIWSRSKSLKVNMKPSVPASGFSTSSYTSSDLPSPPLPPNYITPPASPQVARSLTPPLPERTPASFILVTEGGPQSSAPCLQSVTQASQRIGTSSEWSGSSQPKRFLDAVMNRSKSVRTNRSIQEPLSTVAFVAPPTVVVAGGGSPEVTVQQDQAVESRGSPSNESTDWSDKSAGKAMSRTKSLKFFKSKQKLKVAHPPPCAASGPSTSYSASLSVFKFGFGQRFGKPKGPRSQPDNWV
ncbi:tyrosine-protein phosphatase non-receptor type 22 [Osmerus mordax]|uniref:tyrosine-protein phosphatase non-receptor type 22 n=1 Tax=Osmerus mordax TaxID=8014 RepID=UPI00350FAB5B